MGKLPLKLKLFFMSIYVITIASVYFCIKSNYIPIEFVSVNKIIFFSMLIALTETFTVPFKNISFSTSFSVQLASYIMFGPLVTIVIIILGFCCRILKVGNVYKHIFNSPAYGTVFNCCTLVLPIVAANFLYKLLGGEFGVNNIPNNVCKILIFSILVFFVNTLVISTLSSLFSNKNLIYCFISEFRLLALNILIMIPFGLMIAFIFKRYGFFGVSLTLFPIVLVRYTFSLYIEAKSKYVQTVDVLMNAMEARDKYTQGHSKRVAEIAEEIAKELKYDQWKIENLIMAAMLHDVGKIGVDDMILNKPGKLTEDEFTAIKKHPEIGYNILKDIKDIEKINFIVRHHHERYDGMGYPDGKKAEELNMEVFIIQLADSVDAMATNRPYREALKEEEIINELKKYKGSQFHPVVVDAYLNILEKAKKAV